MLNYKQIHTCIHVKIKQITVTQIYIWKPYRFHEHATLHMLLNNDDSKQRSWVIVTWFQYYCTVHAVVYILMIIRADLKYGGYTYTCMNK